jgi:hypothetical protein
VTILDFLALLGSDPGDSSSPLLIVAEGNLSSEQRSEVVGSYGRFPYAIVTGLSRGAPLRLHDQRALMTGAFDVHLHHPVTAARVMPDGEALARLQGALLDAQAVVTEIRSGYPLVGRLAIASEVDPHPTTIDNLDGLRAVTRFTYRVWR